MDTRFAAGFSAAIILCCASLSIGQALAQQDPLEVKEHSVELGELSFDLGQHIRLARESFSDQYKGEFILQGGEPNRDLPEFSSSTIHSVVDKHKQWGTMTFKQGKLFAVSHSVKTIEPDKQYKNTSGDVVVDLIDVLEDMRTHSKEPVTVVWDNHKPGNSALSFTSGNRQVSVVYYNSPGGSRRLNYSHSVVGSD